VLLAVPQEHVDDHATRLSQPPGWCDTRNMSCTSTSCSHPGRGRNDSTASSGPLSVTGVPATNRQTVSSTTMWQPGETSGLYAASSAATCSAEWSESSTTMQR